MSDIFREVDEEVRVQKLTALWQKYSWLFITLALALVVGVGGWRYYRHTVEVAAAESSARFEDALELSRQGKNAEAEVAFDGLSKNAVAGYKPLARFRAAAERSQADVIAGSKAFDALAADTSLDQSLIDLAKIRAATLLVDNADFDTMQARVGAMSQPGQIWRNQARELLGLSKFKAGDLKAASGYFEQIALDPEASEQLRQRAQIMLGQVRGGMVPIQ